MCGDDHHDDDDDVYSIAIHTYYLYVARTCLFRAYFQFSNLYEWFAVAAVAVAIATDTAAAAVIVAAVAVVVIIIFISSF